ADGDTHGDSNNSTQACDQPSGYVFNTNDCNDNEALAWTGATDTCDGVDNNCSGDELDATDILTWYADTDDDSYGDVNNSTQSCTQPSGYVDNTNDCNDNEAWAWTGATDYCDGIDNNCSGDESDCSVAPDFYLHPNGVTVMCPSAAVGDTGVINGVTYTKRDRAALDALIDAGGMAGVVQSCTSGITDMSLLFHNDPTFNGDITSWDTSSATDMSYMFEYNNDFNQDISGWDTSSVTSMGLMFTAARAFDQDIGGWNTRNVVNMNGMFKDTDNFNQDIGNWDTRNVVHMLNMFNGAVSFNQDLSNWCVYQFSSAPNDFDLNANAWALPQPVWGTCPPLEQDNDGDGQTPLNGDCDDTDATIYAGANETCDGVDNNCSGDELDATDILTWYADSDGDSYGDPNNSLQACTQPSGYVDNGGDCNDNEALAWTGALETCDGVDNNCSGNELDATDIITWYLDFDNDGFGDGSDYFDSCDQPSGYVDNDGDCNDN
ncbi:MAG: BspA family leucine-rich repeat surface protein, partial [Myxococcota bacterium]|nr:BspA family leucine-rich repeat surface protein [Myxococcota bacterium]